MKLGLGLSTNLKGAAQAVFPAIKVNYIPNGLITEISSEVTFNSGNNEFTRPKDVLTFFFLDNGIDVTANWNGWGWEFFNLIYGKLYNWYAIDPTRTGSDSFTSSDDWNIATETDVDTLTAYCIASSPSITTVNLANHLKNRRQDGSPLGSPWDNSINPYWLLDATHYGLDTFRFGLKGGGVRSGSSGVFSSFNSRGYLVTSTESGGLAVTYYARNTTGSISKFNGFIKGGYPVRLVRAATIEEQLESDGTIVDTYVQNNSYPLKCTKIGTQVWTTNVFETKWRNKTNIPFEGAASFLFSDAEWIALTTPGVCNYNNDEDNSILLDVVNSDIEMFTKFASNPVLMKGTSGQWDDEGIRDPMLLVDSNGDLVQEDGNYVMYYNGRTPAGNVTKLGRAISTDLQTWIKDASNPVFAHITDDRTSSGSVIKRGENDYIAYYGYDLGTKFNYATSTDGINWVQNSVGDPILEISDIPSGITFGLPMVVEIDGFQYMVFEVSFPVFRIYMAKASDWKNFSIIGQIYEGMPKTFDETNQANPSIYKVDTDYFIIIYNGNTGVDDWQLGIIHSNSIETGWEQFQKLPVLNRGESGEWDDIRLEGGRVYRDKISTPNFKLMYFGLPTTNSFTDGAIGLATARKGVTIEYEDVN